MVLIHGYWSSSQTWAQLRSRIEGDADLGGLRVHGFDYPSPKLPKRRRSSVRTPDFDDIAQTMPNYLAAETDEGAPLLLITHSQGGLIVQRYLAWMLHQGRARELRRIKLVVMLACPHEGAQYLAWMRAALGFNYRPQAENLGVLDARIKDTQREVLAGIVYAEHADEHHCRIPVAVYAGDSDNIVPRATGQGPFPNAEMLRGDHFSILHANEPWNLTFATLKRKILEVLGHDDGNRPAVPENSTLAPVPADGRRGRIEPVGGQPAWAPSSRQDEIGRPDRYELEREIARHYSSTDAVRRLLNHAGVGVELLDLTGPPALFAHEAVNAAEAAGRLNQLLNVARRDHPYSEIFRTAPGSSRASPSEGNAGADHTPRPPPRHPVQVPPRNRSRLPSLTSAPGLIAAVVVAVMLPAAIAFAAYRLIDPPPDPDRHAACATDHPLNGAYNVVIAPPAIDRSQLTEGSAEMVSGVAMSLGDLLLRQVRASMTDPLIEVGDTCDMKPVAWTDEPHRLADLERLGEAQSADLVVSLVFVPKAHHSLVRLELYRGGRRMDEAAELAGYAVLAERDVGDLDVAAPADREQLVRAAGTQLNYSIDVLRAVSEYSLNHYADAVKRLRPLATQLLDRDDLPFVWLLIGNAEGRQHHFSEAAAAYAASLRADANYLRAQLGQAELEYQRMVGNCGRRTRGTAAAMERVWAIYDALARAAAGSGIPDADVRASFGKGRADLCRLFDGDESVRPAALDEFRLVTIRYEADDSKTWLKGLAGQSYANTGAILMLTSPRSPLDVKAAIDDYERAVELVSDCRLVVSYTQTLAQLRRMTPAMPPSPGDLSPSRGVRPTVACK